MKVRSLFRADIPQVLLIEKSVHVVSWTEETFTTCFDAGYLGWVIEIDKKIVAFIVISLTSEDCHILNVCVARDHQHQGYGRHLLTHALNHAKQRGITIAYLEVRRSNSRAISLYRKMQFHLVGERKDYYPTVAGKEDALIFAISLHDELPQ